MPWTTDEDDSGPDTSPVPPPPVDHPGDKGLPVEVTSEPGGSTSFRRGLWGGLGLLFALVIGLAIREVRSILVLLLVAAFIAIGLDPLVRSLTKRGMRRHWAVVIVATSVIALLAVIIVVLISLLTEQVTSLVNDAPRLIQRLLRHKTIRDLDSKYHFLSNLENTLDGSDVSSSLLSNVFGLGLGAVRALVNTVVVFVLTLYFLGALPQLKRALNSLAPQSQRSRISELSDEILHRTGRYVAGAFAVAVVAGTVTLIFLLSVGITSYAFPLAFVVALLDLVPLVGAATGAGIVIIISFATSLHIGIAAVIFYVVYEILEGYVIYPRVMRSSVDVPEYVTIIAVLIGGTLGGIVGALLSLPIAAGAIYLVNEIWVRRQDQR